jgi:hypothetical protein
MGIWLRISLKTSIVIDLTKYKVTLIISCKQKCDVKHCSINR